MDKKLLRDLRKAYDRKVDERDAKEVTPWKTAEQEAFLTRLQRENKRRLLEIGAGTGVHGKFFHDQGLDVVCTDLSPEMVKRCREKGLTAYTMDFLHLDFPAGSFDAIFAMNCLLHVPHDDLPAVLAGLRRLLPAGGLFYWGQYGGVDREGSWPDDHYVPKRFYASYTDAQIQAVAGRFFDMLSFRRIDFDAAEKSDLHFQGLTLRKPAALASAPQPQDNAQ